MTSNILVLTERETNLLISIIKDEIKFRGNQDVILTKEFELLLKKVQK